MSEKCSICGKRSGNYRVKDGQICGKCYDKYTKAGYDYKKSLTVAGIEDAIREDQEAETTREFKKEDLDKVTGPLVFWGVGFLLGLIGFGILWSDIFGYVFAKEKRMVEGHLVQLTDHEYEDDELNGVVSYKSGKYEFEIDGEIYTLYISHGQAGKEIIQQEYYLTPFGNWKTYFRDGKRHAAGLGALLLSAFCCFMAKGDIEDMIKILKRKKHK